MTNTNRSSLNPTAPLFGGGSTVSSDVVNVALTKSFGSSAVNEARIAYTRLNIFNHPNGGEPHGLSFLASLGFPVGSRHARSLSRATGMGHRALTGL